MCIVFESALSDNKDGALSMIGRTAGTVALLERFSDRPLRNIIALYTKSLCVEKL